MPLAGHREVAAAVVQLHRTGPVALALQPAPGDHMQARAGGRGLRVRVEPLDDRGGCRVQLARLRVPAAVQVDPTERVVRREHETGPGRLARLDGADRLLERRPGAGVGRRRPHPRLGRPVGDLRGLAVAELAAPDDPLAEDAQVGRDLEAEPHSGGSARLS